VMVVQSELWKLRASGVAKFLDPRIVYVQVHASTLSSAVLCSACGRSVSSVESQTMQKLTLFDMNPLRSLAKQLYAQSTARPAKKIRLRLS